MAAKKAKAKAQSSAGNMKVFYTVLAIVAVVGVGGILYARSNSAGMATEPLELEQMGDAGTLLERAQGMDLGEPDAPVQILVFSDYMCPACGVWAGQIEPLLKQEFIETGKVRLTYYDFPLGGNHRYSFVASRAARCSGDQSRFWEFHDHLFGRQRDWSYSATVPTDQFLQIASDIGLDAAAFERCLRSDEHAEVVTANRLLGETLGVAATPTVFLNGRQVRDWNDYNAVKAAIQAAGGV
ncbi:MAG: DsbA family protein [Gemmatimonadota bacterium]